MIFVSRRIREEIMMLLLFIIVVITKEVIIGVKGQQQQQIIIDYKCDIYEDVSPNNLCFTTNDGVCDDPKLGGSRQECLGQDCIDCNKIVSATYNANCYGCMNAIGTYYCPEDGTCFNSPEYTSSSNKQSCTSPGDYLKAGRDGPDACIRPSSPTKDPENTANQWLFDTINVVPVWETMRLTGKGIKIRINDDGVDVQNLDLKGKFNANDSCSSWKPIDNDSDEHGTTVAGIIVGEANNDFCSVGIAHDATFSACNFFSDIPYSALAYKVDTFDISSNSIGMPACSGNGSVQDSRRRTSKLRGSSSSNNNKNNDDGDNSDSIWIRRRRLQQCPFDPPTEGKKIPNPCDARICNWSSINNNLSSECENEVVEYCKKYYRYDVDACSDFNDLLLAGDCDYDKLPDSAIDALQTGINQGRNGKGTIFVFASGNAYFEGDDINQSGWTNSRYTITVGAVGKDRKHADYSTPGAALMVTAPAGDGNDVGHVVTTGLDGTCVDSGPGTSFATPVVSGVIALMLEARPELTWRDVQGIVATTSQKQIDSLDVSAQTNGAGVWHSDWYGFGIINAKKAVDAALSWKLWSDEEQVIGESIEENIVVPNNGNEIVSEIKINESDITTTSNGSSTAGGYKSESVVVLLNLSHYNRGDLKLTLVSPSGTESILHAGKRPENTQLEGDERWKLMTVKNWGENPVGTWKLKVKDVKLNNSGGSDNNLFRQWKLTVYGRSSDGTPIDNPNDKTPTESPIDVVVPTATNVPTNPPPTNTPTKVQTKPPTNAPTPNPSPSPTPGPTPGPTPPPTPGPTPQPTSSPSRKPTIGPSQRPSRQPTQKPTSNPTRKPTDGPTLKPTEGPTGKPTSAPTRGPSVSPTKNPTGKPSLRPTSKPTLKPTTGQPTVPPTSPPTSAPVPPTLPPTESPTISPMPSPPPTVVVVTLPAAAPLTPTSGRVVAPSTVVQQPTITPPVPSSSNNPAASQQQQQPEIVAVVPPPTVQPTTTPRPTMQSNPLRPFVPRLSSSNVVGSLVLGPATTSSTAKGRNGELVPTPAALSYVTKNIHRPSSNRLPRFHSN